MFQVLPSFQTIHLSIYPCAWLRLALLSHRLPGLVPLVAPYNIYNHIITTSTKTLILTVRITVSVYICSTILGSTLIIVLHTGRRMLYNVPTRDILKNDRISMKTQRFVPVFSKGQIWMNWISL